MRETSTIMRERLFTIRMNDEESERLNRVAERYGLNAAGVIRMLIKREDDATAGDRAPSASPRPKAPKGKGKR